MKRTTFFKSLLLAAGLAVGANAWANETRTLVYSNDFEESSDWTANGKSDGWRVNPGTTTANTFGSKVIGNGSGQGDMGLLSPSFTFSDGISIVDVEMKFKMDGCTSGKSSGIEFIQPSGVTVGGGYISAGTPFFKINASANGNGYWGAITVGGNDYTTALNQTGTYENNSLNRNTTGIVVLNARFNFTTKETTFTLKKTDGSVLVASTTVAFGDNTATSLKQIFLHAGKSYGGVTIDDVYVYEVTTSESYADYTVHFVDNNGDPVKDDVVRSGVVGETVNANSADLADYYSGGNKYVYDNDGSGVEVKGDGSAELTITYNKYEQFNYIFNAVDESNNLLAELASGSVYADENSVSVGLPYYVLSNGTLYYQNQNSNTASITSDGQIVNITYAVNTTDVVYYTEGENISGGTRIGHANSSNGAAARSLSSAKFATLEAGKYKIVARFVVGNGTAGNTYSENPFTVGTTVLEYNVPAKTNTTYTSDEFTVTESTDLFVTFAGSSISGVDYIYVVRTGDAVVPVSVAEGKEFATFNCDYALDFSGVTDIIAYTAKLNATGSSVTFTKVAGAVPANTGLLIRKADKNSANVPMVASATAVDNDFIAVTAANCDAEKEYKTVTEGFILATVSGEQGFYKANSTEGTQVGKGKAYLPAVGAPARLTMNFGEEATGINDMRVVSVDNAIYNLNGVRVAQPQKGLYIVNGKKMIIK